MFRIDVTDFTWIKGPEDDPKDLCLHGKVTAHIGDEVLEDQGTVSASAIYLLRSLTEDHQTGNENQMIPCCGHFMVANEDLLLSGSAAAPTAPTGRWSRSAAV